MATTNRDLYPPSEAIATMSRNAIRQLAPLLQRRPSTVVIRPETDHRGPKVEVPLEAFELFVELLGHLANGNAVTVLPVHAEMTTQQAAAILNVSRPHLISLLEANEIPFKMVGTHRRIRIRDLLAYKQADDAERRKTIDELAAEGQDQGFEY